jgi:hypothetical protein
VDNVEPANKPIWTQKLEESLKQRFKRKVYVLPEPDKPVINVHIDWILQQPGRKERLVPRLLEVVSRDHPLINAVHTAFSQHRPLTLSPDCIWLVIAQGFSHHVAENQSLLREALVGHQGKRKLLSSIQDLTLPEFANGIADLSRQIREATNPVLHETLICDFSTTTPDIRTASEVVLMDSYSSYFDYFMHCICGIPKITVAGSVDDWHRIRARVEVLETYGLDWWVPRLRPILDQFIDTVEGHPCREFWEAIYKPKRAYGKETVTGWIADLFPYLGDAPTRRHNHVLQSVRQNWAIPIEQGIKSQPFDPGAEKGASGFPSGLSSVPVQLSDTRGRVEDIDLVGGFLAVEQDPQDLALSPVIGWCVTERAPEKPVMIF